LRKLSNHPGYWLVVLLLSYPFLKYALIEPWATGYEGGDFTIYYVAAERLAAGNSPYPIERIEQAAENDPSPIWGEYPYPPLLARLLVPLTSLSIFTAKYIYIFLCLTAFVWQMVLLFRAKGWGPVEGLAALAVLLGWGPFLYSIRLGQCELLAIPFLAAAWRYVLPRSSPEGGAETADREAGSKAEILAGLCLGVAAMVRVTPVLILPVLAATRRWRLAVAFCVGALLTLLLSGPFSSWEFFTRVLPTMSDVGGMRHCPAFHVLVLYLLDASAPTAWASHFQALATAASGFLYLGILLLFWRARGRLSTDSVVLLSLYLPPLLAGKNPHHYTLALFPVIAGMVSLACFGAARWRGEETALERNPLPLVLWPLVLLPSFYYWFPAKALMDTLAGATPLNGNAWFILGNLATFAILFILFSARPATRSSGENGAAVFPEDLDRGLNHA
jgi:hypothetical protein